MKAMRFPDKVRGVTLIELMISLVIGLVVVGAVIVSFIGSGRAGRYQAALSQMNQDAQVGLNMLAREIQMAGYVTPANTLGLATTALFGCDGTAGSVPFTSPAAVGAMTCGPSTGTTVSAIEVVYEADIYNTVPADVSNTPSDCLGNALPLAAPSFYIARNRFYINTTGSGRRELHCASNAGNTPQPLIENVDDMQLWYGVAPSDGTTTPEKIVRYARAGKDVSSSDTVNGHGLAEWGNVNSVRICLLMRSAEPILTGEDKLTYLDCNSTSQTSNDKYLRRAYFTTATVRTKMAQY
jgi:type IV pilus assembly protein PilW